MVVMRLVGRVFLSYILVALICQTTLGIWHPIQAQESDDTDVPVQPGTPEEPQVYIVSETYSVAHHGRNHSKKHKKRAHQSRQGKHHKRHVRSEERYEVRKRGVSVMLEPQLGIADYGAWEDVRGRVYSFTGAPAKNVKRMQIGGALLRSNTCGTAYDDPTPSPTEHVFTETHYGYSPWTNYERGFNACWKQTGHNYFRIKVSKGEIWVSNVFGDTVRDM